MCFTTTMARYLQGAVYLPSDGTGNDGYASWPTDGAARRSVCGYSVLS